MSYILLSTATPVDTCTHIRYENRGISPIPGKFLENDAMITRHHLALTILCTLTICSAVVPSDPSLILVICAGACTGAIVPDIQMKKPRGFRVRTVIWMVSRFSSFMFTPLVCRLYPSLLQRTTHPGDKRLSHSLPGIFFLGAEWTALILVPSFFLTLRFADPFAISFLCGLALGLVLHLVEDMCTRKGITPFFPFSTLTVSGSIRPCDTADRRITEFHVFHGSVTGIILGSCYLGGWQGAASLPLCLFGICSCLGTMIWLSDVSIARKFPADAGNGLQIPVLSDPFLAQWKTVHPAAGLMMGVYYLNKNGQ